jgi:hypothetical protein
VRRREFDASHPRVQAMERVCVFAWGDLGWSHRCVVGPQGHREAVDFVDARFDPGLKRRDGARKGSETPSELDLKRCDLVAHQGNAREDVTRQ